MRWVDGMKWMKWDESGMGWWWWWWVASLPVLQPATLSTSSLSYLILAYSMTTNSESSCPRASCHWWRSALVQGRSE